jgi:hypothetical protein
MQVFRSMISLVILGSDLQNSGRQVGIAGLSPASADLRQRYYGKATDAPFDVATPAASPASRTGVPAFRPARPDCTILLVRSEGLEPPRCYSLPPQGSASTNSATSAWEIGTGFAPDPIKTGSTAPM